MKKIIIAIVLGFCGNFLFAQSDFSITKMFSENKNSNFVIDVILGEDKELFENIKEFYTKDVHMISIGSTQGINPDKSTFIKEVHLVIPAIMNPMGYNMIIKTVDYSKLIKKMNKEQVKILNHILATNKVMQADFKVKDESFRIGMDSMPILENMARKMIPEYNKIIKDIKNGK